MRCYALVVVALSLTACVVGSDYQRPDVSTPKQWSVPIATTPQVKALEKWWQNFNDPILNQLIIDAINTNLDLKQTLERVKDARTQRSATIAAGLPSFSGKNNVNRRLNSSASTSSTSQAGGFGLSNQIINLLQLGVDAQWEVDFFGGVQRAVEATDATIDSEIENRRDVLVTLLGEVARNYIELRGNQQLIAITCLLYTSPSPRD